MRNSHTRKLRRLLISCVAVTGLVALPLLSRAQPATSVNIVNNSSGAIGHVFLSPVDSDNWSADQISSAIAAGQSVTVSNFACDQGQIKVIGENQDGCFVATVIACGDNATWTITNNTPADCGQ